MTAEHDANARFDVVCVGNITQDWLLHVEHLPALDDVSYVDATTRCTGGRGAIPAMVASALGSHTALCTVIGKATPAGVLEPLQRAGVNLNGVTHEGDGEGVFEVIVAVGRHEQNCISFFLPKNIPFAATDLQRCMTASAEVVYLSTHKRSFNRDILASLPDDHRNVVHNVSPYLFADEAYRDIAFARSSILLGNEAEVTLMLTALGLDHQTIFNRHPRLRALIVTVGASGAQVLRPGEGPHHVPARRTDVHTPVGAGDAFAGGFVHALAQGWDIVKAAELGVVTAAESLCAATSHPDCDCLREHVFRQLGGQAS